MATDTSTHAIIAAATEEVRYWPEEKIVVLQPPHHSEHAGKYLLHETLYVGQHESFGSAIARACVEGRAQKVA